MFGITVLLSIWQQLTYTVLNRVEGTACLLDDIILVQGSPFEETVKRLK